MQRKTALYQNNTPCFVFLKRKDRCDACEQFMDVFDRLSTDPVFANKLAFILMSFGQDPTTGKTLSLPEEYQVLINNNPRVPMFLIHLPNDQEIIDLGNGNPNGRDFESTKRAIIKALSFTPYKL